MDDSSLALKKDTSILADQAGIFVKTVAPYLNVGASDVSRYLMKMPNQMLDSMSFFRLKSCTTEKVDDLAEFLKTRMEKLFTAIHAMNVPIAYGIISYNNNLNLVLGVENKRAQQTVKNLMEGLLSGIELEPYSPALAKRSQHSQYGGILSGIPILKIEDEKQTFDMSSMMHSMIGHDYTVLVFATPYQDQWTQNAYSQILNVRDQCFAVSKKNIARQKTYSKTEGTNKSKTTTHAFNVMLYSHSSGKTISQSVSETIGENDTISSDVQNGMALEMMSYCDKAIERLKFGRSVGMWGTAIAYSADSGLGAAVLKASLTGELAKASEDVLPLQQYSCSIASNQDIVIPELEDTNPMLAPITSAELGMICTPPHEAVPGFELKEGKQYPMISDAGNGIVIGKISDSIRALPGMPFSLSEKDLNKHTFVCGITGSGKTTTVKGILKECSKPFMVIESAKKEYRNLSLDENRGGLEVYTLGKPEINCLQFNPFYIQCGINLQTHIDFLKDLFNASFSFYGPMPYILEQCLYNIYQKKGWNLTFGYHPYLVNLGNAAKVFDSDYMKKQYSLKSHKYLFPTMQDLKDEVKRYIETELRYDGEVGGNIETAMLARLNSLCVGSKGFMFNTNAFVDMDALMKKNVVFELEGLADDSDKAFCVGLLLVFVNEYRQVMKEESNNENLGLQHLLVIEEAHRLLKNVETERTSEVMGNPKGKAVEHFTNMIAEMRSYGQGVIIAEQIPSKLAPDVIKNSSNKIIQRVVSADDQSLVANTIGMKEEDGVYLGSLKTGVALCHKEGMNLPECVFINNVQDDFTSDDMLLSRRNGLSFVDIDYSLVKEKTAEISKLLALKMLNTLLGQEDCYVILGIQQFRTEITSTLIKENVHLVRELYKEKLYGRLIAENILQLLMNGVYSKGVVVQDDLYTALNDLMENPKPEDIAHVKKLLKKIYMQDCRNRCILIISELLKSKFNEKLDLDACIRQYFFQVDSVLLQEIRNKVLLGVGK